MIKKFVSLALATAIGSSLVVSSSFADSAKGQKYYLKFLKDKFGYNGTKFTSQHSQDEWKELFNNNGAKFIEEFSKKHPESEKFLKGDSFQKILPDLKDFAIEFANDSGNVPSC